MHTSPLAQPGDGNAGGMNVYIACLSRALAAQGFRVEAFTLATDPAEVTNDPHPDPSMEQVATARPEPGVVVHTLYLPKALGAAKEDLPVLTGDFGRACARYARENSLSPGIVHAHYWLSGEAATAYREELGTSAPLVLTFHTTARVKNLHSRGGENPEPEARASAEQRLTALADAVVVNTRYEAEQMRDLYDAAPERLRVIPPGVDTAIFRPTSEERRRGAVTTGPFTVLFAGRPQPLKGPEILIEAVALAAEDVPSIRLEIRGTAPEDYMSSLRALARERGILDRCLFVPASGREQLAEAFRRCDVVACPSSSETFGLVALEAQASGAPVLASDVSGLRVAVDDGRAGILVGHRTPEAWARELVRAARSPDLLQRLSASGLAHARTLTWDDAARRTAGLYQDLRRH